MKNAIKEIKVSSVITKEEIERIRLYINKKYPNNSFKKNLNIFTKTIYGIIDKNLEGIDENYIESIRKTIIENTLLKNQNTIFKMDVLDACIYKAKEKPEIKKSAIQWLNKNQKTNVSVEEFEDYVETVNETSSKDIDSKNIELNKEVIEQINEEPVKEAIEKAKQEEMSEIQNAYNLAYAEVAVDTSLAVNMDYNCADFRKVINKNINLQKYISKKSISALLVLLMLFGCSLNYLIITKNKEQLIPNNINAQKASVKNKKIVRKVVNKNDISYHPHLPEHFNFKQINEMKLKAFLKTRNSILGEEPYFSSIMKAAREFDLNPLVLFAITGQEQSFVPKNHESAKKIANNPFNVFHSWKEYNTDIYDASRIASRTVINLSKNKPKDVEIFKWINEKYADDKSWSNGVKKIFENLQGQFTEE